MKYNIIHEKNILNLIEKVNQHLEKGWKLQGGVAVDFSGGMQAGPSPLFQAMVIEDDPPLEKVQERIGEIQ